MKKLLALILALAMIFTLAACAKTNDDTTDPTVAPSGEAPTPTDAATDAPDAATTPTRSSASSASPHRALPSLSRHGSALRRFSRPTERRSSSSKLWRLPNMKRSSVQWPTRAQK